MGEEFLKLENITKSFAGVRALKSVSLSLEQGKTYCLVGENGSGKSTLIKIASGVYPPDAGTIVIRDKSYHRLHPIESIREGIQVIYQDFSLFPNLTVAENVALNAEISSNRRLVNWKEIHTIAAQGLERIGVQLDLNATVGDLPVADRQLIAICKALLQNAKLIIMDEPTSALTQHEVQSLFKVIGNLKQAGICILFVSHKLDEVLAIADRVIILRNGEKVVDREAAGLDRASMVQSMTGRSIVSDESQLAAIPERAPVVLRVDRLSRTRSFKDISFDLRRGEIIGITGLLGSGRTELALALFGMLPADSGKVYVDGREVKLESIQTALQNGIGYVPEDRLTQGLFLTHSIGKNIVVRIIDRLLTRLHLVDHRAVRTDITEWVERLKIRTPSPEMLASSLSGGNQQRLVLAKWLASNPKILILNGPTVGVDVGSKAEIHEIIRNLARRDMGLLVISDDIPELLQVCHRILLMRRGRIVEQFQRQSITEGQLNTMLVSA